jgi:uncharacterized phage protein (TIGR01671 family)
MREIKFRAWDKVDQRMWDVHRFGHSQLVEVCKNGEASDMALGRNECALMQYTGLKDKNGVEIYEGDIIQSNEFMASIEHGWSTDGEYGWLVCTPQQKYLLSTADKHDKQYEVIGNIYENPELLLSDDPLPF